MVAIEIFGGILQLAVDGLVQIFKDGNTGRPGSLVMRFDLGDEYGEALRAEPKFLGGRLPMRGLNEHDPSAARAHLNSAEWVAVTIMFNEAEGVGKPEDGFFQVAVGDVRKHRVRGHRAI